jgi:ferredoxin
VKIVIDRGNCISCGSCWETCPEFFEQNLDDSFSQVISAFRLNGSSAEGRPPVEMEECAAKAAELCCAEVIHVEED